jgi:hypothetical protein
VSWDVHVDLTASMPELIVQATMVHGSPIVAEMVKHIPEHGRKAETMLPVTTEESGGPKGGIGVVIHLSTLRKK